MTSFYNTNKDEYRPVCKYLKQFCFWNLNDRSRRGAKVLDITEQVQTFFRDWSPQDLMGTVVPKLGCPVSWVNRVPRQEELPNARTGEFMSVCRTLIQDYESDAEGAAPAGPRPRPVFMDSDVAFFFVTHNDVCHKTQGNGKEMSDWTIELEGQWQELIRHAALFPRAAIIVGGPADTMGWSDYRYKTYTDRCIEMAYDWGLFACDGREYFEKMEMSSDG